jgi:hypothetical protein
MVGVLTALPGTALWRRLEREGRLRGDSRGDQFERPNFTPAMGELALLRGYADLLGALYSPEGYFRRSAMLVDRIGPPATKTRLHPEDLLVALRAVVKLGLLGGERRHFWRLLGRGARRGGDGVRWAITHAVMAEHMVRYTREHVLPRVEAAVRAAERAKAPARNDQSGYTPLHAAGSVHRSTHAPLSH